ncbi:MAG: tetratricopeptide repeat protein [Planctomycetia bacterium]|nr:tetratricopeptide repeat protein [Planctomycetia bacterium]
MRSRTTLILVLVFVVLVQSAAACLWTYGTNLDGRVGEVESEKPREIVARFNPEKRPRDSWLAKADEFKKRADDEPEDHKLRNDYAVMLVRAGELDEALAVLNEIEAVKPGLYATAANLGTVYELSGDVEKALHWIQEGIARNPKSHFGSEWIHVRILQAKHPQELRKSG